jgi:hypothetical protein
LGQQQQFSKPLKIESLPPDQFTFLNRNIGGRQVMLLIERSPNEHLRPEGMKSYDDFLAVIK